MDATGNDGNASMPEQVKRPNPWRKMMMMVMMMMTISHKIHLVMKYSVTTSFVTKFVNNLYIIRK